MKWNDLTIKQRAEVINLAVKNGVTDLNDIRKKYNEYAEGGNLYSEGGDTINVYGYPLVSSDSEGLTSWFNNNPNVAGMAIGEGLNGIGGQRRVVLNPNLKDSNARNSVYMNESYRHFFDANNVTLPTITPNQREAYKGTSYEGQDRRIQETEAARYLSGDPSHHLNDAQKAQLGIYDFIYPGKVLPEVTVTAKKKKSFGGPLVSLANAHIYDGTTEDNQQMNRPKFLDGVTYLPTEEYEFGVVADKPGKPKNQQFGQRVYAARHPRLTPEQWQEYWGNQGAAAVNNARDKVAPYFMAGAGLAAAPAILANPIINTLASAYGVAEAPRNIREGINNFKQGNYWSGIGDFGTAGLGILGGGMLGYKGLQVANSIAEARIPAYGLYKEIGRTIPKTTPTLNSFYSSDLTGSGFAENVYTGSPLYEFGQTMRTSPEKAYFMRAPKNIDILKLENGRFRHEVVGNNILPSGEVNGKFVSYGEPWKEFALGENSALYEFPIGSRRGPGLMATDWKGRPQKYSVDEVYDYMQREGALNREFRKDVSKLGLDKLKGAERVKAYRALKKEKYPELLEYYDTSIHGANQTVIPNEKWNFDKFLKTPFWKYSENPISGQVQKELMMRWPEAKSLETPTISWTDAVRTPTISPEQWTTKAYGGPMGTYYDGWGDVGNWLVTKAKQGRNIYRKAKAVGDAKINELKAAAENFVAENLLQDENRRKVYKEREENAQLKLQNAIRTFYGEEPIKTQKSSAEIDPENRGVKPNAYTQFNANAEKKNREDYVQELRNLNTDELMEVQQELADAGKYDRKLSGGRNYIKSVQRNLISEGLLAKGEDDGIVGPKTQAAYNKWLRKTNVDGILGNKTINAYIDRNNKEVSTQGVDGCAQWTTLKYEAMADGRSLQNGVIGNAWEMLKNIESKGGTMLFNLYEDPSFNNVHNVAQLKSATTQALKNHPIDYRQLQIGDVVGIFMPSSNMHAVALRDGTTKNTHVGIVTGFDDKGVPIIEHNIHQSHRRDPITALTGSRSGRAQVTCAARPKYLNIKADVKTTKWDEAQSPFTVDDKYSNKSLTKFANSMAGIAPQIQKLYPNINMDDIQEIALAVQKRETNFMNNNTSKQGIFSQVMEAIGNKYRELKGQTEFTKSSDLAKMKMSALTDNERQFLGIKSKADMEDPKKAGAAAALYLARNMNYLMNVRDANPKLGLTDEDIYNLTILSYNQDISDLGFKKGEISKEEVENIRKYYSPDAKVRDVNSTKLKHLGVLGDLLYERIGEAATPYIGAARDAAAKYITRSRK